MTGNLSHTARFSSVIDCIAQSRIQFSVEGKCLSFVFVILDSKDLDVGCLRDPAIYIQHVKKKLLEIPSINDTIYSLSLSFSLSSTDIFYHHLTGQ